MTAEMIRHHYFLQYHLYAAALHLHLGQRLPGYDHDRHFGGVRCLFLRGLHPDDGGANGVFADRPPRGLVEGLAQLLTGGSARGDAP